MAERKKLQVFVSSTFTDLRNERQAAVEAILKAGHIPAGMELFSAGSESQLDTIRRWIDDSDVYMLILGGRYGSIESKTSISYTELEYDYAVSQGKPFFAVVIREAALDEKVREEGKDVLEMHAPKELKLFREKVLSKISSFFSDPKDIKLAVHETLADLQARHEFTGWVSGKDVVNTSALVEEISELRKERDALKKQLEASSKVSAPRSPIKWTDDELKEIALTLRSYEISTKAFNKDPEKPAETYTVDRLFDAMRDTLITGVTNKHSAEKVEILLYYNVCPKLEVHELAVAEKVAGMQWQRYKLTAKGKALLIFFDKHKASVSALKKPDQV